MFDVIFVMNELIKILYVSRKNGFAICVYVEQKVSQLNCKILINLFFHTHVQAKNSHST